MTPEQKRAIDQLREDVRNEVNEKRYRHILGVEETAVEMLFLCSDVLLDPFDDSEYTVRAAALLHDVTKNKGEGWYERFLFEESIDAPDDEKNSPELLHALTAPAYIAKAYPGFAAPTILSAVFKHTTGDGEMSLFDKILCLADYIAKGRTHSSCVELRERFFSFDFSSASKEEKIKHLDSVLLESLKRTVAHLEENGKVPAKRTLCAVKVLGEGSK